MAADSRYCAELEAKAELLAAARQENEFLRQQIQSLQDIIKTMAQNGSSKYDLRGAHFEGGFAETVHGHQVGAVYRPSPQDTS